MANDDVSVIGQLTSLPIGELLRSVALGIAEAQTQLDESSMAVAELMSGLRVDPDGQEHDARVYFGHSIEKKIDGTIARTPDRLSMLELGFTPTFYHFVDTVIEIKVALSIARTQQRGAPDATGKAAAGNAGFSIATTPVDASYSSGYNFNAQFASVIKTKLVPIPPPALLEDRIQLMLQREREELPPSDEHALRGIESLPEQTQITRVLVGVGKNNTIKLGLDIRTKDDGIAVTQAAMEIDTIKGDPAGTAASLAEMLNQTIPEIARATTTTETREDEDQHYVEIQFLQPIEYAVTSIGGGTTNFFKVEEPPKQEAKRPGNAAPDFVEQPDG